MEAAESGEKAGRTIGSEKARQMLAANRASAIDIRGDEEWRGGHIPGARHRDVDALDDALTEIDDDQTVIIACEDGGESGRVAAELSERGREAVSLEGGMEAWRSDDMPMQPSTDIDEGSAI